MSIRTSLLKARFVSRPCLSCVVGRSLRRGAVGPPTASPRTRTHVPWVSCLDHVGVTESRMTLSQRANPCVFVGVVTSCVLCACVRGHVSRSCATENTYTCPRLEALFKLSVVDILRHICIVRSNISAVVPETLQIVRHVLSCRQCRNPPCSRKRKSLSFSED